MTGKVELLGENQNMKGDEVKGDEVNGEEMNEVGKGVDIISTL